MNDFSKDEFFESLDKKVLDWLSSTYKKIIEVIENILHDPKFEHIFNEMTVAKNFYSQILEKNFFTLDYYTWADLLKSLKLLKIVLEYQEDKSLLRTNNIFIKAFENLGKI